MNKFLISLTFAFVVNANLKLYFKDIKAYSKDFKTYTILDIERNLLHNKAQPVGGGERVFEALRDFFEDQLERSASAYYYYDE